jgi:gluconate 5-dehydrogenase
MEDSIKEIFSLSGLVIAITGGYGYLGSAITRGMAGAGANVVVLGRQESKFNAVLGDCRGVSFLGTDVSNSQSVKAAFAALEDKFGRVDVLINNAHYGQGGTVDALTDEAWSATMDGTVGNYHRCIREVLPFFRKRKQGNIINVSSMYGVAAPDFRLYKDFPQFTNPPHYGAGKAATLQLSRYFASLLGEENIRVNAISPGPFPSKGVQKEEGFVQELSVRTALKRIGQPKELIGAFIFLASSGSSYITGHNLVVDGGWTIT